MDEITNWITPLYAGLLGLLLILLAYNVSRYRVGLKIVFGDGGHPDLQRAIRAHANLIENAPMALILLISVEAQGYSAAVIHVLGILLVAGRALHGFGLTRSAGTSIGRAGGILLTWLMILIASALAIFGAVSAFRL
ncbi:MAG: hypothetical protein JWM91_1796 [Rhodospirillales bacterium]|nr:hypothetical protein [Rhodospirillales bacterium]